MLKQAAKKFFSIFPRKIIAKIFTETPAPIFRIVLRDVSSMGQDPLQSLGTKIAVIMMVELKVSKLRATMKCIYAKIRVPVP